MPVCCSALTENTRVSYPINYIDNARVPCIGPHPKNIILLCCDAFGVLPPVSRLTTEQAMYHFISGYTAKVRRSSACPAPQPCTPPLWPTAPFTGWGSPSAQYSAQNMCPSSGRRGSALRCSIPSHHARVCGERLGCVKWLRVWRPQVAGTEQGVTEPEATFSACFGGAFLMWHPMKVRRPHSAVLT